MDIFFQDPTAIPLPPQEVRIKSLSAELWPDNRRVSVILEVTPFQKRPSGEVNISNPLGVEVASVSIIESIVPRMEFTMHLRGENPAGEYRLSATLYYLSEAESQEHPNEERQRMVVDERSVLFEIREGESRE
jgi:hypothetical protein